MSAWQLSSEKRLRNGTSPMSATRSSLDGRAFQHVLVGADALDGAHRARPEPGAGPVGDAEIHRHADERDVEAGEALGGRVRPMRRGKEGRRLRERPFAPLALELGLRHALEFGVVERPALGVGVAAAQIRELVLVHGSIRQMCSG